MTLQEKSIVITGAARTPIGAFNGGLSTIAASELGAVVIAAAMKRAGIAPEEPTDGIYSFASPDRINIVTGRACRSSEIIRPP